MRLTFHNVFAGYDGGDVLKGVNLVVEQGSITCLVGPNGAGKSTLLRVISGLLPLRRGTIDVDGHSLVGKTPRQILDLGIVHVPQSHSLFHEMLVGENVRLGAYLQRDLRSVARRFKEIEERFPIVKERAHDKAGSLSGGQQRLVELARSLMLDPSLMVLDEPSLGLEPRALRQVFETVTTLNQAGKTILLVEQHVRTGLHHATHGVVMESGLVRLEGPPEDLLSNTEMSHLYLGGTHALE